MRDRVGEAAPRETRVLSRAVSWSSYDFLPPGVRLMWSGSYEAGAAKRWNHECPDYAKAFSEDKIMIKAQQRVIDMTPLPKITPSAHDRAVSYFNRLVEMRVAEELSAASPVSNQC